MFEVVLWQPPPPGWNLQYRFNFGDGTETDWSADRQATHTYLSPGSGPYAVHVEIASRNRDRLMSTKAIDKDVDVIPVSNPIPSATATATSSSTATATPSAEVTPSPSSTDTPLAPTATTASTATPFASPNTPPSLPSSKMPWLYVIVGAFGAAALGYWAYAKSKMKALIIAGPTFYAHSDWKEPQTPPRNLAIKYELHFNSNISAGQDRTESHGASLIQQRRKQ